MRIVVRHAPPLRQWHRLLAAELAARGHVFAFAAVPVGFSSRRDHRILRFGERALFGARCPLYAVAGDAPGSLPADGEGFDLAVVLAGDLSGAHAVVQPLFDGTAGERALLVALLRGEAPLITVRGRTARGASVLSAGRPALEDPQVLARALRDVLPRLVTLLVQAVERVGQGEPPAPAMPEPMEAPRRPRREPFARTVAIRLARRLRPTKRRRGCRWQIAFRFNDGPGVAQARRWEKPGFTMVPHGGKRFFADPFPFEQAGRRHMFFEEFSYALGRGVIARVEIGDDGMVSTPVRVLEAPFHLSYPFVLRHREATYMLPEAGATRRLRLYRADPFPDRWITDRVLLDGTGVADATPVFHGGRWWLFAVLLDNGGSSWDALGLFHAPDLLGPWTPHVGNPVLIDAGAARPAGAMWHENGALMRVAQDCRGGYGHGIAICRVDRLDDGGYAQTVVARLSAPDGSFGVHTINRSGRLETIDIRDRTPG